VTLTSSKARQHAGFGPLLPDVHHVPYAYRYRCQFCGDEPACNRGCIGVIEEDLFARHLDPHDVAAIFIEPIQGEGGYVVPPPGYLADLRALCDRYGILLVADEVQSGVGRTGKMFACDHAGRRARTILLTRPRGPGLGHADRRHDLRESITPGRAGSHGSTFGGNPVCCAAALATLDLVESGLMANAARLGEKLMAGACRLMNKHSCIGDVRGRGSWVGWISSRTGPEGGPRRS
jgi:4-aminobutyrate aminotransferase